MGLGVFCAFYLNYFFIFNCVRLVLYILYWHPRYNFIYMWWACIFFYSTSQGGSSENTKPIHCVGVSWAGSEEQLGVHSLYSCKQSTGCAFYCPCAVWKLPKINCWKCSGVDFECACLFALENEIHGDMPIHIHTRLFIGVWHRRDFASTAQWQIL